MLDERKLKAAQLRAQGTEVTEVARQVGIERTTFYTWLKDDEFVAELNRCTQEFLTTTRKMLSAYGPKAVDRLIKLAERAESEKVKLDAASKILDKLVSNATKIEIDTNQADDHLSKDILDEEFKDIDNE